VVAHLIYLQVAGGELMHMGRIDHELATIDDDRRDLVEALRGGPKVGVHRRNDRQHPTHQGV
jgi:hypothetical protein